MGITERANKTIISRIHTIRLDSGLPTYLWRELTKTAVYLINRSPTRCLKDKTLYKTWYGHKPDLSYLKIIGSAIYYLNIEKIDIKKLDPVTRKYQLIGYRFENNQYRVWNPETIEIKDVTFVKINETDYRMTDREIALAEDIRTDEIDPYEPTDNDEESESGNEKSHSNGNNKSDSDDQTTYESEYRLVTRSKQTIEIIIPKRKSFTHMLFATNRRLTIHKPTYQKALNSAEAKY